MLVSFACPQCGSELEVEAEEAGTRVDCPACSTEIRTPLPRVAPGTTLGGFHIERRIGGGAMGDVYLARQLSMDRMVALKVLPQAMTRKPHIVERFQNEVRMSARLEHPHVVTAFEAGEDFGYHFLAMSYVDGLDLGAILKQEGPLPEKQALTHVRQVADALCYAWNTFQMLHRDVKPSNIMVDRNGKARLLDLGISKSLAEETADEANLTLSGMLVGTPHYMSPEQAQSGTAVDSRADIYSLGATLYHLLTGSTPYQGKTTVEVIRQLGVAPVRPVREIQPAVTEHCARLVEKMMAFDLSRRHPRWESVLTDIDRVLSGRDPLLAVAENRAAPVAVPKDQAGQAASRRHAVAGAQSGRRSASATSTTAAVHGAHGTHDTKAPPRIDLRRRRMGWIVARTLRRTMLLSALLVLVGFVAVIVRKTGLHDALRDRLARRLAAESQVTDPAFDDGVVFTEAVRSRAVAERTPPAAASELEVFGGAVADADDPEAGDSRAARSQGDDGGAISEGLVDLLIARVADLAVEEMIKNRPANAEAMLRRAALNDRLVPYATEFYQAAAVAGEAAREEELFRGTLADQVGKRVTLQLAEGPLRVSILQLEKDTIAVLRLHERDDTPLGRGRIPLADLSVEERLQRLRQFEKTRAGDVVLTLFLWRHGRREEALEAAERLPPMLAQAFRRRAESESADAPSP